MATDYNQGPPLDATPPLDAQVSAEAPHRDLQLASQNYWAGRTGRETPPAPTFRMIDGKKTLGRYMDPYGCQLHMRASRMGWEKWYVPFLITIGISIVFGPETDFFGLIGCFLIFAPWYFLKKAKFRRWYDSYLSVQAECLRTDEPQWMPYSKKRLRLMDTTLPAVNP